jgi:hypothetical protein
MRTKAKRVVAIERIGKFRKLDLAELAERRYIHAPELPKKYRRRLKLEQLTDVVDNYTNGVWLPVPRVSKHVPFGYEVDPNDEKVLLPIKKELDAVEIAKRLIRKRYKHDDVARWLSKETGKPITRYGLEKRIRNGHRRRRDSAQLRKWASIAEEKARLARKFAERTLDLHQKDAERFAKI